MNRGLARCLTFAAALALVLALAACAAPAPRPVAIERMTSAQLAALKPVANPAVTLQEIVAMGKAGMAPANIIKRLADTHTLHVLSARQIIELSGQGVDPAVIDYLVDTQEKARQSRLLTELADRDAAQALVLQQERQRRLLLEQSYPGYGGFPRGPLYGRGMGYQAPFYYPNFPNYPYRH